MAALWHRAHQLVGGTALLALVAVQIVVLDPRGASALPSGCEGDLGTDLPVVFVHGLTGEGNAWTDPDGDGHVVWNAVTEVDGVRTIAFDYRAHNTDWVDDDSVGPQLARLLACLARRSLAAGGRGKVAVVGHSMGGLAARAASGDAVESVRVGDRIGLVITIGTPHLGSDLAEYLVPSDEFTVRSLSRQALWGLLGDFCRPFTKVASVCAILDAADSEAAKAMRIGTQELQTLPDFDPATTTIRYIAGDISTVTTNVFGRSLTVGRDLGDFVVSVSSAVPWHPPERAGGGSQVFSCSWDLIASLTAGKPFPSCFHLTLIGNPEVAEDVRRSIEAWMDANPVPEGLDEPLTITIDPSNWDPEASDWDEYGPAYESNPLIAFIGSTHTHAFGRGVGRFTYHFPLSVTGGSRAEVSARLSSEFSLYAGPPDGFSDVTLNLNGQEYPPVRVIPDDGSGKVYTWTVDPGDLQVGENTITFSVQPDAEYRNGIAIYHEALVSEEEDAAIVVRLLP